MSTTSVVKHHLKHKEDQPRQKRFKVGKACFTCRVKKIKVVSYYIAFIHSFIPSYYC